MSIILDGDKGINQNTTEVTKIPVGTTAQRPASPEAGMMRFNTDAGYVEWYDDVTDNWLPISDFLGVIATGGTVTDITQDGIQYRVHTFTSDGTFEVTRGGEVEYLVVAGGGGGGSGFFAGGGGAGGYRSSVAGELSGGGAPSESPFIATVGTFSVTVGGGGVAAPNDSTPGGVGGSSVFATISANGGGGGGSRDASNALSGGSGGGGGRENGTGAAGTAGQGFGGGNASESGAGGGGASQAGANGSGADLPFPNPDANGGDGVASLITGVLTFRAGGGGGGGGSSAGSGGNGGGGNGGLSPSFSDGVLPQPGQNGTGGGGGGAGGEDVGPLAAGGSGIVIVRYRIG